MLFQNAFGEDPFLFISQVNRISPARFFFLHFFFFTFTRARLVEDNCSRKEVLPTERLGVGNGQNETGVETSGVWALGITATASAPPPAVQGNIFQSFSIVSFSPPFLEVSSHRRVFPLSFVRQLLELTYPKKDSYSLCHLKINCTSFTQMCGIYIKVLAPSNFFGCIV